MKELLTALEIENKSFAKVLRGYDPLEVDEFLDSVAESLHDYAGRCKRLEHEIQLLDDQLKEYANLKNSLQEALLMAQRSADEKVSASKQQGEAIIAEARAKSENILFDASREKDHCMREVNQLKKLKRELTSEIRTLLSRFSSLVEPVQEDEYPDQEDS